MNLNELQIQYIKRSKGLLQRNDFDSFFANITPKDRRPFADFFYSIGIDLFEYLSIIPEQLFKGSSEIIGVTLPSNVKGIGSEAFKECSSLTSVSMSDSVSEIGNSAFEGCASLKNVNLSNSITTIPAKCFSGDISLNSIFLPDSVKFIKPSAFSGCSDIKIYMNPRTNASDRLNIKQSELEFFKSHLKKAKVEVQKESLKESFLLEDFSPSMPKWLRARLLTQLHIGRELYKYKKNYPTISSQDRATFADRKRSDQSYDNLLQAINSIGIDISNAKFIEDGFPKLKNDPRVDSPNIPFFHLVDETTGSDTVYAKGLNDNEYFKPLDKPFKYIPLKTLLSYTKDFCYLDGSDPDNLLGTKKQDRANMKRDLKQAGVVRYKDSEEAGLNTWSSRGGWLDKSGYIVNPRRFKEKLKELKKQNISKNLEKTYQDIRWIQSQFANLLMDRDFRSTASQDDYSKVFGRNDTSLMQSLERIISYYNQSIKYVELATNDPNSKDYYLDVAIGYLNKAKDRIKSLKEAAADILDVPVDWELGESMRLSEDIDNMEDIDMSAQNPVMQNAVKQDKYSAKEVKKELDKSKNSLPKNSQKVIGAEKQEVPDKPEQPKITLDESLFKEAKKNYEYLDLGYIDKIRCSATVYDDGSIYVKTSHPYDDSDYHWAVSKDDGVGYKVYIHSPGKFVKSIVMGGYDDKDELIQQVTDIAKELINLDKNSKIKPKIIHN